MAFIEIHNTLNTGLKLSTMMTKDEIFNVLRRKATTFQAGGFRPTNQPTESWIGRVFLFKEEEELPLDAQENPMWPLLQLYLPDLPFVPDALKDTAVLTVFISQDLPEPLTQNGENWLVREYDSLEQLQSKTLTSPTSFLKPFPLKPHLLEEDYPDWDSKDIPPNIVEAILALRDSEGFDYIKSTGVSLEPGKSHYDHKIGGWTSFCQSGIDFGENYQFALQIVSDNKVKLNIVDGGQLLFAKNSNTGDWKLYYDFY